MIASRMARTRCSLTRMAKSWSRKPWSKQSRRSLRRRLSCAVVHLDADSLEAIRVKWRAADSGLPRVLRSCGCKCLRSWAPMSCCVTLLTHRWNRPSVSTDISRHRHPLSLNRRARMRAKTCSRGSSDGSCLRKRQRKSFTSCENLSRLVQPAPNRVLCTTLCRPCGIVSPGVDLTGREFVAGVLACSRYVKSCRQSRQVRLSVADASEISGRKFVKGTWRRQATATQQRPKRGKFKGKPDDPSAWLHDSLGQTVGKAIKMMKKQSRHELALEMMRIV